MNFKLAAVLTLLVMPGMVNVAQAQSPSSGNIPGLITNLDRLSIGPKQDDPSRGLKPNPTGLLMIGPKQDDPSQGLKPNPTNPLMIGPKQDDPSQGLTPNPTKPLWIAPK